MAKKNDGYITSVRKEFKKVNWPKKGETAQGTMIVLAISIIVGVIIRILDLVFSSGLGLLLK